MVRKRRPSTTIAGLLATAVGLTAAMAPAWAETRGDDSPPMPVGAAAPAPQGFVDLCLRAPDECPAVGPASDLKTLAAEANRRRWTTLFGMPSAALSGPAAPPAARTLLSTAPITRLVPRLLDLDGEPVMLIASLPEPAAISAEDDSHAALEPEGDAMVAGAAAAAADFATSATEETGLAAPEPAPTAAGSVFTLDRPGWRVVNAVNRQVNRAIRHVEDRDRFGQEDHWTRPEAGQGDCEDYVLAKRFALIESGVPAEALSIAIVETAWGETHAVLLLASDRGEYVLDSLSPWVLRWDRVDYRWRERQVRGGGFDWVSVAL